MSPEIASTWLKLTGKKRSREFSHSLDPKATAVSGSFQEADIGSEHHRTRQSTTAGASWAIIRTKTSVLRQYRQRRSSERNRDRSR
jgi:hypothetical protein